MKKAFIVALLCGTAGFLKAQSVFPTDGSSVGIGTNTPISSIKLHITDGGTGAAASELLTLQTSYGLSGRKSLTWRDPANVTGQIDNYYDGTYTNMSFGHLYSAPFGGYQTTDILTLRGNGYVGIGTSAPGNRLEVAGSAIFNPTNSVGNFTEGIRINNASNNFAIVHLGGAAGSINNTGSGQWDVLKNNNNDFGIWENGTTLFSILKSSGNVGIGITDPGNYKLGVNGTIHSKAVVVDLIGWPDYVFKPTFHLTPLSEVKAYIDLNHHLPDMPSEKEVADSGLNLGEMNKLLTKKVEELTLYLIEQQKEINELKKNKAPRLKKTKR